MLRVKAYLAMMLALLMAAPLIAGGKVGLYGLRQVPDGTDAKDYSRAGWGGGIHAVAPLPQVHNLVAGTIGFDITNLLNETLVFYDPYLGDNIEQQTDQNIFRLYLGGQVGGHGNGFIRPHAGMNLSLLVYNIRTDAVVKDDLTGDEIRKNLYDDTEVTVGWDMTLGLDLNFSNGIALDGGVRYLRSFSVPQQLAGRSEKIHPRYFQVYLGVGVSFRMLEKD